MKKTPFIAAGFLLAMMVVGCNNAPQMDDATMNKKVDSLAKVKMAACADSAAKMCTANKADWTKHYCDSLCTANGMEMK